MSDMLLAVAVASGAFIATNLDNLVLLVALFGRFSDRSRDIVIGYLAGALVILAITFVVGKIAGNVPVNYLGLLGVFPILIGLIELGRLFRSGGNVHAASTPGRGSTAFIAVLLTQLSNSVDTIVTFSVLFSDADDRGDRLVLVTFAGMAVLWVALARKALRHAWVSRPIQRYGRYITPFILIAVGVFVLSNTALDMLPDT